MDVDSLFLASVKDLERYAAAGDDYSMLRAAALLRQVLMDESPLAHQANRERRLRLRFPVCGRKYAETVLAAGPVFYSRLGAIHRSGSQGHDLEEIPLDAFLSTTVLKLGNNVVSVGDLISISANVLGGVHRGAARGAKEQSVEDFNRRVVAFGQPITAAQMRPVILVALEGLQPLVGAIGG